jgi:ubiquinone/menaquinone biosynthesis C-methylase UbiE
MVHSTDNFASEVERIEQAYDRRRVEIPSERYSWLNPGQALMIQEMEQHILSGLAKRRYSTLRNATVLDVGCGDGRWLRHFIEWGARPENLFGVDLLEQRIERARQSLPVTVNLVQGSATQLEFEDRSFDFVLQFTAFSSILLPQMRHKIACEMIRVLKPGGHVIWYDFHLNNPWNDDVRGISKKEIRNLFPGCHHSFERVTPVAPVARILARLSPLLYHVLASTRIFSTHYLAFIQRQQA